MNDKPNNLTTGGADVTDAADAPVVVDRTAFQAELDALRVREKAHTGRPIAQWSRLEAGRSDGLGTAGR